MPPLLALASSESTAPGPVAAREAINKIVAAVAEDGLYLLIAQVAAILQSNLPCTQLQGKYGPANTDLSAVHVSQDMALCDTPSVASQLEKGLEDTARRRAAAHAITIFCTSTRLDFQEHVPSLLTVSPSLRIGAHKHFAAGAC